MSNKETKSDHISLGRSFVCASKGILHAIRSQRNMKIHLVIAAIVIILGFLVGLDALSWTVIALCIALVIAAECFNTALESLVDLVAPEHSKLAGRVKDCAAGAVFVCAIGSVVVGLLIFVPRIGTIFGLF